MIANPALALRETVLSARSAGFVRWDRTGRALLVSDAPRHGGEKSLCMALEGRARVSSADGLLWIDLPEAAYRALLSQVIDGCGPWVDAWFEEQALIAVMLSGQRGSRQTACRPPNEPLLRAAMLACASSDEHSVRTFCRVLRRADAVALRERNGTSCVACAALIAGWLAARGVGVPPIAGAC